MNRGRPHHIFKTERQQKAENWAREQADLGRDSYDALLRRWYLDHPLPGQGGTAESGQ